MMETDLTKMVEELGKKHLFSYSETQLLLIMTAEIKANREEIEKLKEKVFPNYRT